jgi:hypothetical protein
LLGSSLASTEQGASHTENNRAFQNRPAIVGANEEKGGPESAKSAPGICCPPGPPGQNTFASTPSSPTVG